MTLWLTLGGVLIAFFLLSFVRVGGKVEYSKAGVLAYLKIGSLYLAVYPVKPKPRAEKERRKKKEKKKPPEEPIRSSGGSWESFRRYAPLFTETAGRFIRKIRIDRFSLDLTVAAPDPAAAAMQYGYANATLGMIWPLIENNFKVKERRIRTAMEVQATVPTVYVQAVLSLTVGQAVIFAVRMAVILLRLHGKVADNRSRSQERVRKERDQKGSSLMEE